MFPFYNIFHATQDSIFFLQSFRRMPFRKGPFRRMPFRKGPFRRRPFRKGPFRRMPFRRRPFRKGLRHI